MGGGLYDETCDYSGRCDYYGGIYKNETGFVRQAKQIIIHPEYASRPGSPSAPDLCLVEVDELKFEYGKFEQAYLAWPEDFLPPDILLPEETNPRDRTEDDPWSQYSAVGDCEILGWGETETGKQSSVLLSSGVDIMSEAYCNNLKHPAYHNRISEKYFCAGKVDGGQDTCRGDSGG